MDGIGYVGYKKGVGGADPLVSLKRKVARVLRREGFSALDPAFTGLSGQYYSDPFELIFTSENAAGLISVYYNSQKSIPLPETTRSLSHLVDANGLPKNGRNSAVFEKCRAYVVEKRNSGGTPISMSSLIDHFFEHHHASNGHSSPIIYRGRLRFFGVELDLFSSVLQELDGRGYKIVRSGRWLEKGRLLLSENGYPIR